jgi:protoporphyrinogen oxidase
MHVPYLIIGAGPTGLGAAWRLTELGENDFLVLERDPQVGGLAASFTDAAGFTWDVGGHVVFSHYEAFDRLLAELLGADVLRHQRESWIRVAGTFVPYPFQNNIRRLPPELAWECVEGLLAAGAAAAKGHAAPPADFGEWVSRVFGPGIARLFMIPYNFKVWAHPAQTMSHAWIGERVSVVDAARVIKNIVLGRDDVAWGPNNTFSFPLRGGTGEIYRRLASRFADRVRLSQGVLRVDPARRMVRTTDGQEIGYDHLLTTAPLDLFVTTMLEGATTAMIEATKGLAHNGTVIHGLGFDGAPPDPRCWMYFPESDCPFYRITNFHNYSPNNTPDPDGMRPKKRAIMTETSFSEYKPEDPASLVGRTVDGLVNTTILDPTDRQRLLDVWERRVDYAYPIPSLTRDAALAVLQPALARLGIASRGRFGAWKYEVGNMDHSFMQGVQWVERMAEGKPETVHDGPDGS